MRPRILLLGASLGFFLSSGLAAQATASQPERRYDASDERQQKSGGSSIQFYRAYTERRWIGLRSSGSGECPPSPVKEWQARPLLAREMHDLDDADTPETREDLDLLRKLGLDRVCVYSATVKDPPAFIPPPGVKAQKDRMAISASGSLDQIVSPTLADHFRSQTGSQSPLALQSHDPTVRLAFIDSQPRKLGFSPPVRGSRHGYTLAQLARQIVCNGPCAATVVNRRALHYVDLAPFEELPPLNPAPETEGGNVGLVSDIARAIVEEVLDWRHKSNAEHLILNISLGWDGELFGDLKARRVSQLDPSARAVYDALRFASRHGVLVIASAGNRRAGPDRSSLPTLPAAWELRRPGGLPFGLGRKLVYSVGGVDWQGLPLPNFRHGGRPRRTAYGDHAVAVDTGMSTPIYTGSSVSAAVVSSVAAIVWHLRPELWPDQVMAMIGRSGEPLATRADFYPWQPLETLLPLPSPRQRRISACRAVAQACGPGKIGCSRLASAPACKAWDRRPPLLTSPLAPVIWPNQKIPPGVFVPPPSDLPCEPRTLLWTAGGRLSYQPCPTDQFGGVLNQRWAWPQPPEVPCPGCTIVPDPPYSRALQSESGDGPGVLELGELGESHYYTLKVEIHPDWQSNLKSATLDIDRFANGVLEKRMTYAIDLAKGYSQVLTGLGDGQSLLNCTAQIHFIATRDGEDLSVQNPVVVDP